MTVPQLSTGGWNFRHALVILHGSGCSVRCSCATRQTGLRSLELCPEILYIKSMNKFNYSFTSSEDNALVDLIAFVEDMGLPPNVDRDAYESLSNKILDNIT